MIGLSDFAGLWALSRRIEDTRSGAVSWFEGTARFTEDGAGLTCDETGQLRLPGQAPLVGRRRTLWRCGAPGIAVLFADGRPFHRIDDTGQDTHQCPPDTYAVAHDFADWPRWRAHWRVTGPKKDYVMESCHTRVAGAETGQRNQEGTTWPRRQPTAF